MNIIGRVTHYAGRESVNFDFSQVKEKKGEEDIIVSYNMNLAFEIWKKFKDSKVKITIEKVK